MFAFLLSSTVFSNPAADFCLKLGAFPPLPAGEGRGEGENYRNPTATTHLKQLQSPRSEALPGIIRNFETFPRLSRLILCMRINLVYKSILAAALLPLLAGCVEREVVYRDRPAPPPGQPAVVEEEAPAPPPPQVEIVPVAPDPTFVWVGGEWIWGGPRGWYWGPGHWGPRPHPGAYWVHGGWGWRGHHRVWVGAHWH
jgi:hypothetical protein